MRTLEVGDVIPETFLKDIDGNIFETTNFRGKKQLVIIFYPIDGTNGCKNRDCKYHDVTEYFNNENYLILGISGLSPEDIKNSDAMKRQNFPVISDQDKRLRKLFGVCVLEVGKYTPVFQSAFGLKSNRITFVTDKEGKIIYKTDVQNKLHCQSDEALQMRLIMKKNFNISS